MTTRTKWPARFACEFAVIRSFDDIRHYIRQQAAKTAKGQWIFVPKTFPARLKEMRIPLRFSTTCHTVAPEWRVVLVLTGLRGAW